ncbi:MAG: YihY/virulence factor BrkB family protein [Chlorobia bacterium]|nr:YihY/virulence factor BrkB family protein [Fimbriimonadaceae bacterium]
MHWRDYRSILIKAGQGWSSHSAPRLAAALSFYAILSLAPMLVIAVTIATAFLDSASIRASLSAEATQSLGKGASDLFISIIDHASKPATSVPATIIAIFIAFYAASGLFAQIEEAIEDVWGIQHQGNPFRLFLMSRLKSVVFLLGFLLIFLVWLATDSILGWLTRTSGGFFGWPFISLLASTLFATLVFALTFKAIPRGRILWRDVWPGAITTGLGFSLAKFVLSLYFTYSGFATAYGSAGALVVILLWIYYSSQIFFFGAEITQVVALQRKPKPAAPYLPS